MNDGGKFLASRPGVGLTANVVQRTALRFSRLVVDRPALILLLHGSKTLRAGTRSWTAQGGDAIAIAAGQAFDVSNRLSADGRFEARWIVWDPTILARASHADPSAQALSSATVLKRVDHAFGDAVHRAAEAIRTGQDLPDEVARHRLAELLVWLSLAKVRFATPRATTLSATLRHLFAGAPSEDWTMPEVAGRLAMSEATLRRRLGAEGASFTALLGDVRMSSAMTLLQATDQPISRIALDVGYDSASRFAVRFRERFGFAPSAIRGQRS